MMKQLCIKKWFSNFFYQLGSCVFSSGSLKCKSNKKTCFSFNKSHKVHELGVCVHMLPRLKSGLHSPAPITASPSSPLLSHEATAITQPAAQAALKVVKPGRLALSY